MENFMSNYDEQPNTIDTPGFETETIVNNDELTIIQNIEQNVYSVSLDTAVECGVEQIPVDPKIEQLISAFASENRFITTNYSSNEQLIRDVLSSLEKKGVLFAEDDLSTLSTYLNEYGPLVTDVSMSTVLNDTNLVTEVILTLSENAAEISELNGEKVLRIVSSVDLESAYSYMKVCTANQAIVDAQSNIFNDICSSLTINMPNLTEKIVELVETAAEPAINAMN
ncbi:uncharacterized protein NEPG_01290 [Nematocida parisii ERTm1]|uniref:Uncharacterized protein n=1 Tax=Nematocida parisii (strain ERTm3) TaxID=935791 RepID=I3EG68_NEMP3|nr:uncharacterized protein NEPG_01290 [Nematocida parisii ERTm1]EIJ88215.1 hypothetical protein NEQG_01659 [Nematocida parisii ERTm3]EIJ93718.1 hypothetical protein NEPG_01290 [Nematocida parisii ERTm1]|eukprot:XP_013059118.1 hypothetical protein NEPG_01290 [Nematocida parisii ERTm1]